MPQFSCAKYCGMYITDNTNAMTIETANVWKPAVSFVEGMHQGFTFQSGRNAAVTAFANAGGGKVTVTSASHGLSNGDPVGIIGTTSYNGLYLISGVTANSFDITAAWVANDATGRFYRPPNYTADVGSAGVYRVTVGESFSASANNKVFRFGVAVNATVQPNTVAENKVAIAGDVQSAAGTALMSLVAGDKIYATVMGVTDTTSMTARYVNMTFVKAG